jgi:microcystin-dependent protein
MSDAFVGEIRMFGGNFAPAEWAFCDGRLLPISVYSTLFSLIGNTYGGDGVTNFAVPDLRGRLPVHQGDTYILGQAGGAETVILQPNQVAAHTHVVHAKSGAGDKDTPSGNVWASAPDARYSANPPALAMKAALVSGTGGGQAHDNVMPFQAVNFIICLNGYYPNQE